MSYVSYFPRRHFEFMLYVYVHIGFIAFKVVHIYEKAIQILNFYL